MSGRSVILSTLFLGKPPRGWLPVLSKENVRLLKQRTNGPVNAHLIPGPKISTKSKFDITVKLVKVKLELSFIQTL